MRSIPAFGFFDSAAGALLVAGWSALVLLAVLILVRNLAMHWRGALVAGTLSLWFWGMALAAKKHWVLCLHTGRNGIGDPMKISDMFGDFLIGIAATNLAVFPLVVMTAIILIIHRPKNPASRADMHEPAS